ncbi:hypothetical protein MMSR116_30530 [Methylobacterium mesophilicum SR1.6/6]|uniref:Uncharacterized protein n=1 Tax=Methylobacterium mesophilicum SR1.6/6 TaxID=908290 RepID=A0A6B9FST9_9HYPH|nr:hypothetical protein [Methylobacterium mesophilicum]QGY05753.1 hypothetical protein MMSR116_30530 [Methylobacterium mesophilicum SR1.6/6]
MTLVTRSFVHDALPPIKLTTPSGPRCSGHHQAMLQLRRVSCVAAALALPALGIAYADTVHRAGVPRAPQTAAPVNPSDGAAVPSGAVTPKRALRAVKTAAGVSSLPEVRA